MKVLEISKDYLKECYDGDISLLIGCKDGVIYDDERIKNTFNCGNGTISDFKRYLNDNKKFCYYYDLENNKILYYK